MMPSRTPPCQRPAPASSLFLNRCKSLVGRTVCWRENDRLHTPRWRMIRATDMHWDVMCSFCNLSRRKTRRSSSLQNRHLTTSIVSGGDTLYVPRGWRRRSPRSLPRMRFCLSSVELGSGDRPEISKNRWDQFRNGRMDRHSPLQRGIERTGVHDVEDPVDRLVPIDA
jgi:hypothetical protein